jgi:hypothetical protein
MDAVEWPQPQVQFWQAVEEKGQAQGSTQAPANPSAATLLARQ